MVKYYRIDTEHEVAFLTSFIRTLMEELCSELGVSGTIIENVNYSTTNSRTKQHLPIVAVTPTAIVLFVDMDKYVSASKVETSSRLRSVIQNFSLRFNVSLNSLVLCGYRRSEAPQWKMEKDEGQDVSEGEVDVDVELYLVNTYTDRIVSFSAETELDDFAECISGEISCRREVLNEKERGLFLQNLQFASSVAGEVKIDLEGNAYISKRGKWFAASDIDAEQIFKYCALGGMFGAHKFLEKKKFVGFIYFITCGLFGVGWVFDCLSLLSGIYKDKDGKYIMPISDKSSGLKMIFAGLVISVVYFFVLRFAFFWVSDLFAGIMPGEESLSKLDPLGEKLSKLANEVD